MRGKRKIRRARKAAVALLVEQWRRDLHAQHLREHFPERLEQYLTEGHDDE